MENDYFSKRATIREFSDKKISQTVLSSILEKAMRAPTCGNMQLYSVVVTREKENKEALSKLHFDQPAAKGADVLLTVCADFNRFSRWCRLGRAEPGYANFHSFMMACTDAVILAQQIATVAETEGLGTCWLGTVNYNAARISELLELPALTVPVAALALGYPAASPEQPERLPVEAWVHNEKYRKDTDGELLALHEEKEEFPANKRFVEENGKQSLAQVFTDIRYPRDVNEAVSESFLSLLRDKGFMKS